MRYEVAKVEKSNLRVRIHEILFLSFSLILAQVARAPVASAQNSYVDKADGKISGIVLLDGNNRPATQVAVKLKSHLAGIFRSVLTDFEGHFEVRGLPASTYEIVVEEPGYEPTEATAEFDGSSSNLELRLKSSNLSQAQRDRYTVSARQLKIPGKAQSEFKKGLESLAKKDLTASLGHFTKAEQAFPEYYEAYYHMGLVQTTMGKRAEAREAFQKSIDLSGGRYAWAELGIGYLLYQEGKTEEAVTVLRRGLELDGNSPDGHLLLGMALLRLNKLDEAEKSATEALLRNPNFGRAYLLLADAYGRRHEYGAQLRELDAYLKLDPSGEENRDVRKARVQILALIAKNQPEN
jgi:tetratricopeptide (TPR) repeat protein